MPVCCARSAGSTVPASAATRPASTASSVDFPEPDGPVTASIVPGSTTTSTSSTTRRPAAHDDDAARHHTDALARRHDRPLPAS